MLSPVELSYCFPLIWMWGKTYKKCEEKLQVIEQKRLQVELCLRLWGSVSVEVWSARDHFVPLTMRAIDLWMVLLRNSFSPDSGDSLREKDLRVLAHWIYLYRFRVWILESKRVDLLLAYVLKPPKKFMLFKKPLGLESFPSPWA